MAIMVRRDETERAGVGRDVSCCAVLAGASPVRVSAGAPGSRRRQCAETRTAKRRVESLEGGSNEAGRNKLNAEQASSYYQPKGVWEYRAGHVAAKAMHSTRQEPDRVLEVPRVLAAARFDGAVRNMRDPSRRLTSSKDRAYEAGAESARSRAGVPGVGGVISPLLANIYLHVLDRLRTRKCNDLGMLVRYADDFVVMCRTSADAKKALRRLQIIMQRLSLELHPAAIRAHGLKGGAGIGAS
jgi:reverse transcriptase-like protein